MESILTKQELPDDTRPDRFGIVISGSTNGQLQLHLHLYVRKGSCQLS